MQQVYEEMSINSAAFNEVATDFDVMLQKLLRKMQESNCDEGKIVLEVGIVNEEICTEDDAELEKPLIQKKPTLRHKVSTQIPIKDSMEQKATDTGMILVWDKDLCRYVLVDMATKQTTMFDQQAEAVNGTPTAAPRAMLTQGANIIDLGALPPRRQNTDDDE